MKTTNTNGATKPKANRLPKVEPSKELHPDEKSVLYQESLERFRNNQCQMPKMLPLWVWVRMTEGYLWGNLEFHRTYCSGRNIYRDINGKGCRVGRVPESLCVARDPVNGLYWIGEPSVIADFKRLIAAYNKCNNAISRFWKFKPEGFEVHTEMETDADDEGFEEEDKEDDE